MPTDEEILRFKSMWYPVALRTAQSYELSDTLTVRITSAPAFLATKWEAFADRGDEDWYGSHDVEDIVMVVAGRPELPDELKATEVGLRDYVIRSTTSMFDSRVVDDVIAGALAEVREVSGLLDLVLGRFERIVRLSS